MLIIFTTLSFLAIQFYFASFGMLPTSDHSEYIIVGAGPAGSLLVTFFIIYTSFLSLIAVLIVVDFRLEDLLVVEELSYYLKQVVQLNTILEELIILVDQLLDLIFH